MVKHLVKIWCVKCGRVTRHTAGINNVTMRPANSQDRKGLIVSGHNVCRECGTHAETCNGRQRDGGCSNQD